MIDYLSSRAVVVSGHGYQSSIDHHVSGYLSDLSMHFLGIKSAHILTFLF